MRSVREWLAENWRDILLLVAASLVGAAALGTVFYAVVALWVNSLLPL